MKKIDFIVLFSMVALSACTTTQQASTTGAVGGAALGGIIGHQSGNGGTGAAIGAAVGSIGGMIVGEKMEKKYCPVCGNHYRESVVYCPKDGAELKYIDK